MRRRKGNRGGICPLILSGIEVDGSHGPPLFQALDSAPEYKNKMGLISTHRVIFSLKERRNACHLSQYGYPRRHHAMGTGLTHTRNLREARVRQTQNGKTLGQAYSVAQVCLLTGTGDGIDFTGQPAASGGWGLLQSGCGLFSKVYVLLAWSARLCWETVGPLRSGRSLGH